VIRRPASSADCTEYLQVAKWISEASIRLHQGCEGDQSRLSWTTHGALLPFLHTHPWRDALTWRHPLTAVSGSISRNVGSHATFWSAIFFSSVCLMIADSGPGDIVVRRFRTFSSCDPRLANIILAYPGTFCNKSISIIGVAAWGWDPLAWYFLHVHLKTLATK
jgi:hypothetical protein